MYSPEEDRISVQKSVNQQVASNASDSLETVGSKTSMRQTTALLTVPRGVLANRSEILTFIK